jgi:hypothetical protein
VVHGRPFFSELDDPNTVYFFDPVKGRSASSREPRSVAAFTVNTSSPHEANYLTFRARVGLEFAMPTLSMEEVAERIPYYRVARATIMDAAVKVGGSARTLFRNQQERPEGGPELRQVDVGADPTDSMLVPLHEAIKAATLEEMCALELKAAVDVARHQNCASHELMKIDVDPETYKKIGLTTHTNYIRDRLVEHFEELQNGQLELLASNPKTNPGLRWKAHEAVTKTAFAGEAGVVRFTARELVKGNKGKAPYIMTLEWHKRVDDLSCLSDLKDVALTLKEGESALAWGRTGFEFVDGAIVNWQGKAYGLQLTNSPHHETPADLAKNLLDYLEGNLCAACLLVCACVCLN